jgi:hypothetical protein
LIGAVLGLVIVVMRLWIPESPRWLMIHGDVQRAETIVSAIEERLGHTADGGGHDRPRVRLHRRTHTSLAEFGRTLFRAYRKRVEQSAEHEPAEKIPGRERQDVPAHQIRRHGVEVGQDKCIGEKDRIVEECLRGHQGDAD